MAGSTEKISRIPTKNSVRWVIALIPEAIPIIHALRLKKISGKLPFPIYIDDEGEHWLTVSGLGEINVAAATSLLFEKSRADKISIWINVGIAGSKRFNLGELVFIDKVTSNISGKSLYPYSIPNLKIVEQSQKKDETKKMPIMENPKCLLILNRGKKISRNDRCEATGKKYKNCCGAL